MSRLITHEEVKKHADEKSSWIIIHHDVYDVTNFLDEHPGGADSLLEYAGKDGSQAFEDVAHSMDAREMMEKYKIGTIPAEERKGPKCGFVEHLNREFIVLPASGSKSKEGSDGGSPPLPGAPTEPCGHCSAPRTPGPCGVCEGRGPKVKQEPRTEPHLKAIVVPKDRRPRVPPCEPEESSSSLKWVLIALAGAIVIAIAVKKYKG